MQMPGTGASDQQAEPGEQHDMPIWTAIHVAVGATRASSACICSVTRGSTTATQAKNRVYVLRRASEHGTGFALHDTVLCLRCCSYSVQAYTAVQATTIAVIDVLLQLLAPLRSRNCPAGFILCETVSWIN